MRLNWVYGVVLATALTVMTGPASAQVSVYIGSAPPPLSYEERSAAPGPVFAWWKDTGLRTGVITGGCPDAGTIRTTITISRAGNCMKAIGIMTTTTVTATRVIVTTRITTTRVTITTNIRVLDQT